VIGLLQRLVRDALTVSPAGAAPRLRSAMRVQPQAPLPLVAADAMERDGRPSLPAARAAASAAEPQAEGRREAAGIRQRDGAATAHALAGRAAAEPARPNAAVPPRMPVRAAEGAHRIDAAASRAEPTPSVPRPLLAEPAAPAAPLAIAPLREPVQSVAPAQAADAYAADVHVHIGRIDVTAVHAPAEPKPKPRAARPSMPLADYLSRRRS
jgi:hypothetical protein